MTDQETIVLYRCPVCTAILADSEVRHRRLVEGVDVDAPVVCAGENVGRPRHGVTVMSRLVYCRGDER